MHTTYPNSFYFFLISISLSLEYRPETSLTPVRGHRLHLFGDIAYTRSGTSLTPVRRHRLHPFGDIAYTRSETSLTRVRRHRLHLFGDIAYTFRGHRLHFRAHEVRVKTSLTTRLGESLTKEMQDTVARIISISSLTLSIRDCVHSLTLVRSHTLRHRLNP